MEESNLGSLHSEEIEYIISRKSPMILRSGIYIMVFIFLGLIASLVFIRSPDILNFPVTITTVQGAPAAVGTAIVVKADIPLYRTEKIIRGQKIMLRLRDYPYEDYGKVVAVVEDFGISDVDTAVVMVLRLTKGMETTKHIHLKRLYRMSGTAEIETGQFNLFHKLFSSFHF